LKIKKTIYRTPVGGVRRKKMYTFITNESGATALEYSMIVATSCLGAVLMLSDVSRNINGAIESLILTIS